MAHILGLDISSSKVGIALIDYDENIIISEVLKFKPTMTLEERVDKFAHKMKEIDKHYVPFDIFVEQPAMMFKGGKTTAQTIAKLQRFNGMCCYALYTIFDLNPTMINPNTARSAIGIKVPRGIPPNKKKQFIIENISNRFGQQFSYQLTYKGNPKPGTDDRADALVVALAGLVVDK